MARYGWDDVDLKFGIVGGTWYSIKQYIDDQEWASFKAKIEEFFPKGNTYAEKIPTGGKEHDGTITLRGLFDDTATSGPDALFNNGGANIGALGKVAESVDGTNYDIFNVVILRYQKLPQQNGGLTRFEVELDPYGAPSFDQAEPTGTP